MKKALAIFVLLLVIAGAFFYWQYQQRSKIAYKFDKYKIVDDGQQGVSTDIYLSITNPFAFGLYVLSGNTDIILNGKKVGTAKLKQPTEIAANQTSQIILSINVDITKVVDTNNIASFLNSPFVIDGALDVSVLIIRKKDFPIHYETTVGTILKSLLQ